MGSTRKNCRLFWVVPLGLFFLSITTFASPIVNEQYNYYKINGSTGQQLRQTLNNKGPSINGDHFDAQVTWYVNWHYNWMTDPLNHQCKVTAVKVTLQINRIMPTWIDERLGELNLQKKWDTYLHNLSTHEQGHATNGIKTAEEIEQALLNTAPQTTCTELEILLNNTGYAIIQKHNAWDIQYDKNTHHGRTQGAFFP